MKQYLIPMKPGFLKIAESKPAAPSRPLTKFDAESVWSTPSGLIGATAEGSSAATASTQAQAEAFVTDETVWADSAVVVPGTTSPTTVWHLNLLRFSGRGTKTAGEIYQEYGGPAH